jgi:uncharacterized protein YgbK (DUF1537 family)
VTSSYLSENMALGHDQLVGLVNIDAVRGGEACLTEAVRRALDKGERLIAVDAATDNDLAAIAQVALKFFPDLILSGSAGLAQAIAARLPPLAERKSACTQENNLPGLNLPSGSIFFVGGSASTVLRTQLENLAKEHGITMHTLKARTVLQGISAPKKEALRAGLASGNLIICLSPPESGQERLPSQALALALGDLAVELMHKQPKALSAIFVSGGDTAQAVLNSLGNPEVVINCELAPGFIVSTLDSGPCSGLRFLTKSGSFGQPAMLSDVYGRIQQQK